MEMRKGLQAMYNMFNLLVEQATAAEGRVVDRARAWCSNIHVPFFRFNPQHSHDTAIDEHDDSILVRMMWETRAYMSTQTQALTQLKHLLLPQEDIAMVSEPSVAPVPPPRRTSAPNTPTRACVKPPPVIHSASVMNLSTSEFTPAVLSDIPSSPTTSDQPDFSPQPPDIRLTSCKDKTPSVSNLLLGSGSPSNSIDDMTFHSDIGTVNDIPGNTTCESPNSVTSLYESPSAVSPPVDLNQFSHDTSSKANETSSNNEEDAEAGNSADHDGSVSLEGNRTNSSDSSEISDTVHNKEDLEKVLLLS